MNVHVPNVRAESGVTGDREDEGVDLGVEADGLGPG